MEVKCPKCSVVFVLLPGEKWDFGNNQCVDLRGTTKELDPRWCQTLSDAVESVVDDILLLPYGFRETMKTEIASAKAKLAEKSAGK